ncbi:hypothetical protein FRX31_010093 [Thalictrum thalictroides]|uniref:Uncharacterized protein n=1 Tax=Thalictrum thalictroides TaxID=46969 RepID=A0A7J6WSH7_THATH|nr:hypothetical protein FRX31_010093 [Thalictrum thalictroides]
MFGGGSSVSLPIFRTPSSTTTTTLISSTLQWALTENNFDDDDIVPPPLVGHLSPADVDMGHYKISLWTEVLQDVRCVLPDYYRDARDNLAIVFARFLKSEVLFDESNDVQRKIRPLNLYPLTGIADFLISLIIKSRLNAKWKEILVIGYLASQY